MDIVHYSKQIQGEINIGGSKSESNRWLMLQKLYPEIREIHNLSDAEDTHLLKQALYTHESVIDVHQAGTAMRFLIAYFAMEEKRKIILTGSKRMQQRPVFPLVDAINSLGGKIEYLKNQGYPPLQISRGKIKNNRVEIPANISSQYISALMLVAPKMPKGLEIHFTTIPTSIAYIEMTKKQMEKIGIQVQWLDNGIKVYPAKKIIKINPVVESDWSSASYWYSLAALSSQCDLKLNHYRVDSLQGDAQVAKIYQDYFGVDTRQTEQGLHLTKKAHFDKPNYIELNLNNTPDIAQTIAVTCAALRIKAKLKGLYTLKIKETDRLVALQNELKKIGVTTNIGLDFIEILDFDCLLQTPTIETYNDHRMAMSFAPLGLMYKIQIENPKVVVKSYPNFWEDLEKIGFNVQP